MCGRKKPNSMIDKKLRVSNDLEVIIYELKKEIDRLNEELQAKEIARCLPEYRALYPNLPLRSRNWQVEEGEQVGMSSGLRK